MDFRHITARVDLVSKCRCFYTVPADLVINAYMYNISHSLNGKPCFHSQAPNVALYQYSTALLAICPFVGTGIPG
ncbi:Uncharacterised protein [Shigella sonnei]|nr:Uncharacterised protein [Shigella sonnei]CSG48146.1 Uncharacterised protein [Shigella sonnei]CSP56299.1 Uncharacterised protein [Shigella sonnei]CSR63445.1 Uncharacterised protein [Shigella sonnei]